MIDEAANARSRDSLEGFGFDDEQWIDRLREAERPLDLGAIARFELIEEVSHGEYEADCLQTDVSRLLYDHETEVDPISVYFIMKLFRLLGELANHAENTGDNLRMMLAKQ